MRKFDTDAWGNNLDPLITEEYLYKYLDKGPWLVGTTYFGRYAAKFIRRTTKNDIKNLRKKSVWLD